MKKLLIKLLVVFVIFIMVAGCATVKLEKQVQIAGLNYEVVGPVTVEGKTQNILGLIGWGGISYSDLLAEARKMGADDVINVSEDKAAYKIFLVYNERTTILNGTAIKYTDTFTENLPQTVNIVDEKSSVLDLFRK